jgi:hypothetical protein
MNLSRWLRRHVFPVRAEDVAAAREEYGIDDRGEADILAGRHTSWPALSEGAEAAGDDLEASKSPRRPSG